MNISPLDIKREIEKEFREAPILQRGEVAKSYIGLEINNWIGKINSIMKMAEDSVHVSFPISEKSDFTIISFDSKLSEYPEFKTLKPNQEILIKRAKIAKADWRNIKLSDCEISFDIRKPL